MAMHLGDDGTLDTVVRCSECGAEYRFNYASAEQGDTNPPNGNAYDSFVMWAIEEATETHSDDGCAVVSEEV